VLSRSKRRIADAFIFLKVYFSARQSLLPTRRTIRAACAFLKANIGMYDFYPAIHRGAAIVAVASTETGCRGSMIGKGAATPLCLALVLLCSLFVPRIVFSATPRSPSTPGVSPDLPEITVIAPRAPTPSELAGDSVEKFVTSHSKPLATAAGQLAHWKEAVCVETRGLPAAFNDFVSARVEAIAASVKVSHQTRKPCKPNVHVIFTTKPQQFMDDAVKSDPAVLGFHYMSQVKKLKTIDHPVQAWHVTGRDADGSIGGLRVDDVWGGLMFVESTRLGSRLSTGVRSYILLTLVVVDGNRVLGYPIGAISDYVAMVTLSQMQLTDGCGVLPSILDLMATACTREKSQSITAADLAYLQALNTVGQEVEYSMQKTAIEINMRQQFAGR